MTMTETREEPRTNNRRSRTINLPLDLHECVSGHAHMGRTTIIAIIRRAVEWWIDSQANGTIPVSAAARRYEKFEQEASPELRQAVECVLKAHEIFRDRRRRILQNV